MEKQKFEFNESIQYDNIKENEDDFLTLLVYAGYLTQIKGNMFRIPNKEVKSYFYSDILSIWLKK